MARFGVGVALVAGALLAVVLPTLLSTPTGGSGLAAVVLALVVLAVSGCGVRRLALVTPRRPPGHSGSRTAMPAVLGSATDPVHSPLRPRAPGLV